MRACHLVVLAALLVAADVTCCSVSAGAGTIFEAADHFGPHDFDPGARSLGMGGASGAVTWGETDVWANPALLGFASGFEYTSNRGLYEGGPLFRAQRYSVGGGGVGVFTSGDPVPWNDGFDVDADVYLLGAGSQLQDALSLRNRVRSWGAGFSLADVAAGHYRRTHQTAPAWTRHADFAAGFAENIATQDLYWNQGTESPHDVTHDLGLLAGVRGELRKGVTWRTDFGFTAQNLDIHGVRQHRRQSAAARIAVPAGRPWGPAWLAAGRDPLLSIGVAYDHDRRNTSEPSNDMVGAELGFTRLVAVQVGHVARVGNTWGLTLLLPLGRFAEVRFQRSEMDLGGTYDDIYAAGWLPESGIIHNEWSVRVHPALPL